RRARVRRAQRAGLPRPARPAGAGAAGEHARRVRLRRTPPGGGPAAAGEHPRGRPDGVRRHPGGAGAGQAAGGRGHRYRPGDRTRPGRPALGTAAARSGGERPVRTVKPLLKLLVFAAVTLTLTALLAGQLGSLSFGGTGYRARFTDVTGVLPGDDVRIAGVKVGQVTRVRLVDNGTAELSFTVDGAVPLPAGVRAAVRYRNLIGQRYLALTEGPGTGVLPPGGLIPLSRTAPALDLTALFNGFRPLFTALTPQDVNSLAYEIIQVFQGDGGTVADLLGHAAS